MDILKILVSCSHLRSQQCTTMDLATTCPARQAEDMGGRCEPRVSHPNSRHSQDRAPAARVEGSPISSHSLPRCDLSRHNAFQLSFPHICIRDFVHYLWPLLNDQPTSSHMWRGLSFANRDDSRLMDANCFAHETRVTWDRKKARRRLVVTGRVYGDRLHHIRMVQDSCLGRLERLSQRGSAAERKRRNSPNPKAGEIAFHSRMRFAGDFSAVNLCVGDLLLAVDRYLTPLVPANRLVLESMEPL